MNQLKPPCVVIMRLYSSSWQGHQVPPRAQAQGCWQGTELFCSVILKTGLEDRVLSFKHFRSSKAIDDHEHRSSVAEEAKMGPHAKQRGSRLGHFSRQEVS